jgi:hypothetical protein
MIVDFPEDKLARTDCTKDAGSLSTGIGASGTWKCVLATKTPLCIKSLFDKLAPVKGEAFLPGSTLRGSIRNTVEILGGGCGCYWNGGEVPEGREDLRRCTQSEACPACRIFGFVDGDFCWGGKVRFYDSDRVAVTWMRQLIPAARPANPPGDGWMVFPAVPAATPGRDERKFPVPCVPEGTRFPVDVQYWNLSEEEYDLLKFAVTLRYQCEKEDIRLLHTLGYAKSAGLGACQITIPGDQSRAVGDNADRFIEFYIQQAGFAEFEAARRADRLGRR